MSWSPAYLTLSTMLLVTVAHAGSGVFIAGISMGTQMKPALVSVPPTMMCHMLWMVADSSYEVVAFPLTGQLTLC